MQLRDKTALITGATTGIGFAAARRFLDEGAAHVVITGQDEARLEAARLTLADLGKGTVTAVRWRADEVADIEAVVAAVRDAGGSLDVVFANAGVTWPGPLGQIDAAQAQQQLMINVTGPLMLIQSLVPTMNDGGSIVLTTSCLDQLAMPGMTVYAASKAAMRSLARTLSAELKDRRIRVNTVAPGPIETPIYSKLGMDDAQLGEMAAATAAKVPLGRFGQPDEIAGAVTFLASDASSYLLGEEISVDGGWSNL